MSSQEKEAFDEWLSTTVVPSSIVAVGLLAFAIMGGGGFGGTQLAKAKPETMLAPDTSLFTSSLPPANNLQAAFSSLVGGLPSRTFSAIGNSAPAIHPDNALSQLLVVLDFFRKRGL